MKSEEIYNSIKNQIIEKKYQLGDRLPTEFDLMNEYNVGRSTIREVLTSLTSEGIIEKRHGLGSYVTRVPAYKGTICICVRFENLISSTVWYPTLIKSINTYAKNKGYDTIIAVGYGQSIKEIKESIDAYFRKPFSKEIVAIVNTMAYDMGKMDVPVINFSAIIPYGDNAIYIDYNEIFIKAKELFKEKGYDNPAIIYTEDSIQKAGNQQFEHLKKLADSWTDKESLKIKSYDYEDTFIKFKEWYESPKRSNALFIQDDGILDNIIPYLYMNNVKIPEDLAIITFANTHKKFNYPAEFYRFGSDHDRTAKILLECLDKLLKGESVGVIKLSPIYIPGNSL